MNKHVAQINVAVPRTARDDPSMVYIFDNIEAVFALAERSKGFVWRVDNYEADPDERATIFGRPDLFINLSVWESLQDFQGFAFNTVHSKFLARRDEWFYPSEAPVTAMWWIDVGHTPTLEEAHARLEQLRSEGPGPEAFSLSSAFDAKGVPVGSLIG